MAVINYSIQEINTRGDHGHVVTWGPLGLGDDGNPLSMIGSTRRTVQVIGTIAAADRVTIEGSNDKVNWSPLTDTHGNQMVFRAPGISTVADLTLWIRPRVTAGAPTATVIMLLRKTEAR